MDYGRKIAELMLNELTLYFVKRSVECGCTELLVEYCCGQNYFDRASERRNISVIASTASRKCGGVVPIRSK